jgi:hypothetical protein
VIAVPGEGIELLNENVQDAIEGFPVSVTESHRWMPPSVKVTLPPGRTPDPLDPATVALKVTAWLTEEGFDEDVRVVWAVILFTVWAIVTGLGTVKFESPL